MKPTKGICKECAKFAEESGHEPQERWIVNKSKMLCNYHNELRKKKSKPTKHYVRKATGELDMFKEIWEEREHVSFVSGEPLDKYAKNIETFVKMFAHILSKGAYPAFRLRKDNIVLLTPDEHFLYDMANHKIKEDQYWAGVYEMKEKLKIEYNNRNKIQKL